MKALRLWLVLVSAHLVGCLAIGFALTGRAGLPARGWTRAAVIPVAQTGALSALLFIGGRWTRRRS